MDITAKITHGFIQGLYDSMKGVVLLFYIDKHNLSTIHNTSAIIDNRDSPKEQTEPKIKKQIFKCCALNGGFAWLSIIIFEYIILPGLKYLLTLTYDEESEELVTIWRWLHSSLSIMFGTMWLLPVFLLSRIVSSLWFQDIANSAYEFRKGRPQLIPSISKLIADTLFSLLVQALFLVQSMLVNLLPIKYAGITLYYIHLCMLYSLYSFEYKWFNMGWELHKRLNYIESNWPYFIGFGIPLTILTNLTDSYIISGCIFSTAFPIFILSGNEAQPVIGSCDFPLRLFSPVVAVSNVFFNKTVNKPTAINTQTKISTLEKRVSGSLRSR